jgi:hypothetical protein
MTPALAEARCGAPVRREHVAPVVYEDYSSLYAAVLALAVDDLKSTNPLRANAAESWIFASPDFDRIVTALNLEPGYIRRRAINIIKKHEQRKETSIMRISSSGVEAIARDEARILDKKPHEMTVEELRAKIDLMRGARSVGGAGPKTPRAPKTPKEPKATNVKDIDDVDDNTVV